MQFTYRDLEQLTGIAYYTLAQWKSRGLVEADGDGAGTKNDPLTFTDEMVYRLMWIAQLSALNVQAEDALTLWAEAVREQYAILFITDEAQYWVESPLCEKTMKDMFSDYPMFLTVSVPHFMASAKSRIANFQKVTKFKNKIGLPTDNLREPTELVH